MLYLIVYWGTTLVLLAMFAYCILCSAIAIGLAALRLYLILTRPFRHHP